MVLGIVGAHRSRHQYLELVLQQKGTTLTYIHPVIDYVDTVILTSYV